MKNVLIVFLVLLSSSLSAQVTSIPLTDWQLNEAGKSEKYEVKTPVSVHSALLEHGVIEDPFVGDNEFDVQWITERDWVYETAFELSEEVLDKEYIVLELDGLDTYTSIELNGKEIGSTNNAFRRWSIPVKGKLKKSNTLRIEFTSPSKVEKEIKKTAPYDLPEGNRVYTRKAQFQYGWDWGPILNTIGIWRPVKIVAWDGPRIENVYVKQKEVNASRADLDIQVETTGEEGPEIRWKVYADDAIVYNGLGKLKNGKYHLPVDIARPRLWWPHNIGEPYLYDIRIEAHIDERLIESKSIKTGIRTIELVAKEDRIGQSFYFNVNGQPVYAKGANYIPQHSLQDQVTEQKHEQLLSDVVAANMNMLRVWGGGIYEDEAFYRLCDEKGILLWQDFMFACAMYPGDDAFLENVRQEAIDNVKRLRNHASIALWCGNNESSEGWHRWGWQMDRSRKEKKAIWKDYKAVFNNILPDVVESYHDEIDYWESSPKYGRGDKRYISEGDAHDWWVWHDAYPFEHFEEAVPRFMSEFGFQSFPSYEAIRYINGNDSVSISAPQFQSHQKHKRGYELIREYMGRDFPVPADDKDYVYMSQMVQAHGMIKGIKAHRRAKPYNMGTLYWQLNDCWPVVSWSSIDFLGKKKAFYYQSIDAFDNLLVSPVVKGKEIRTYIVNDDLEAKSGVLRQRLIDFDGREMDSWETPVTVAKNGNVQIGKTLLEDIDTSRTVLVSEYEGASDLTFFTRPKNLDLVNADIDISVERKAGGYTLYLKSETLQYGVFLSTRLKGEFSNNYFHLLPGEEKVITFDSKDQLEESLFEKSLKITSLNGMMKTEN